MCGNGGWDSNFELELSVVTNVNLNILLQRATLCL